MWRYCSYFFRISTVLSFILTQVLRGFLPSVEANVDFNRLHRAVIRKLTAARSAGEVGLIPRLA